MNTRKFGLMVLALLLCLPAWASNSRGISFRSEVSLNGVALTPGRYEISWVSHSPEATVTFFKAGHMMVTGMAKWVERDVKYSQDAIVYTNNPDGSHTLIEIRFAGGKEALVFAPAS